MIRPMEPVFVDDRVKRLFQSFAECIVEQNAVIANQTGLLKELEDRVKLLEKELYE